MKNLPLNTRRRIQEFVAEHDYCHVCRGLNHRRNHVLLTCAGGYPPMLLGRPRSDEAVTSLVSLAAIMVNALEREKIRYRAERGPYQ